MKIYGQREELRYTTRHPLVRSGKWVMLTGLLLLLTSMIFWWPTFRADDLIKSEYATKIRSLTYARQSVEVMRQFYIDQEVVPQLEERINQRVTQSQLVDMLDQCSKTNNVTIVSENYEKTQSDAGEVIIADMIIVGKYRSMKLFMQSISALPIWIELQEVEIEKPNGSDMLRGRMRMVTPHRK